MQSPHQEKRPKRRCRYVVFPGMVDSTEKQRQIVQEVLLLHHQSTRNNGAAVPCPVHVDDNTTNNGSFVDKNHRPLDKVKRVEPSAKKHDCCFCKTSDFWQDLQTLQTSRKLELGLACCGGDVTKRLPIATRIARRAFARAAHEAENNSGAEFLYCNGNNDKAATMSLKNSLKLLQTMGQQEQDEATPPTTATVTPLTGLSLLYGPLASMPAHYDSPTQPGQREEWLAMISLGSSIIFRCNDELVKLDSGDVIVMDSMATLHGVESVLVSSTERNMNYAELGLQTPCRLGLLFWQGRPTTDETLPSQGEDGTRGESLLDGVGDLFADDNDDDNE